MIRSGTKWKYTAGIIGFACVAFVAGCEKEDFQARSDAMAIARFEPLAALSGDTIAIIGQGFNADAVKNVVQFNASQQSANVLSVDVTGTRLEVIVPADAQAGNVKVATGIYSTLSALPFLLSPSIGSVNPDGALPGDQITVTGKNFTTTLSNLLLYIGDVAVDSIFGGSSTQIIFPLPEGLPVGNTTIRVGTRLTATDSVLSPPVAFTVFDPEQPTLTTLNPNQGPPGTQFTIKGNAFKPDPGKTVVMFGNIEITDAGFTSITTGEIVLNVPAGYPIAGKGQEEVDVIVKVMAGDGERISSARTFTVLEPSNLEFYYGAVNELGFSKRADDSLYRASVQPGGAGVIKERLNFKPGNAAAGIEVDGNGSYQYITSAGGILKIDLSTFQSTLLLPVAELEGDLALDEANNFIFVDVREDVIKRYNLVGGNYDENLTSSSTVSPTVKIDGEYVYYILNNGFSSSFTLARVKKDGTGNQNLFSEDLTGGKMWVGIAIGNDKVYLVESPLNGFSESGISGSSVILHGNKDGSGSLETLYDLTGKVITDIEISKDKNTLYWMVVGETGAIEKAPVTGNQSQINVVIPGIRNGRYFDILER